MWHTLTDLEGYRDWNPFLIDAAGTFQIGQRLRLRLQPAGGRPMTFKPWVTAFEEHRYLEWLGRPGIPGVFDGRHSVSLTPLAGGRTLFQQSETFAGLLVPLSSSMLARTRAAFAQMNDALGERSRLLSQGLWTGAVRLPGSVGTQIYEGTNQVQRIVMARQLRGGVQSQL